LVDVLRGAAVFELCGEFNEDWLRILRVRRVLTADRTILFDVEEGHDHPRVEAAIDDVNTEYLDLLLDLTGDTYTGTATIALSWNQPLQRSSNPDLARCCPVRWATPQTALHAPGCSAQPVVARPNDPTSGYTRMSDPVTLAA